MRTPALLVLLLSCLALVLTACPTRAPQPEEEEEFEGDEPGECSDGADNDQDGFYDCDDQDCWTAPDCTGDDDSAEDDDGMAGAYIYAHTATQLYEVEPDAPYTVSLVGPFSGRNMLSQGITDIAVDLMGEMWGVGFFEIYEVDVATAGCTERAFDPNPLLKF